MVESQAQRDPGVECRFLYEVAAPNDAFQSSLRSDAEAAQLSFVAAQVNSRLMVYPAEVFLLVGLLYFLMCSALEQLALWVGRRFSAERRAARREATHRGSELGASQAGANTAGA